MFWSFAVNGSDRAKSEPAAVAPAEELQSVFQLDGERSRYLVDPRNRLGGFRSQEQIKRELPSFDDGMVENMKDAVGRIGKR